MIANYKYNAKAYFIATFFATFTLWFAGAWMSHQEGNDGRHMLLMLPGLMAPFLISLFMIFRSKNRELIADYKKRLFDPRLMHPRTFPVLFSIMPFSVLLSIGISLLFGESASQFRLADEFSFSAGFVPVLLLLLMAAAFEELGWRGYAFDSLQSRYNFLTASVIFGILWSAWHFPLVFVDGSYQYQILHENVLYGLNFFIGIVPMGVIVSWVCVKNGKSILSAILFHFVINISQEAMAMTQMTKCIQTFVLAGLAVFLVLADKETFYKQDRALRPIFDVAEVER